MVMTMSRGIMTVFAAEVKRLPSPDTFREMGQQGITASTAGSDEGCHHAGWMAVMMMTLMLMRMLTGGWWPHS
jgi:hypothetical protein